MWIFKLNYSIKQKLIIPWVCVNKFTKPNKSNIFRYVFYSVPTVDVIAFTVKSFTAH